MRHLARKGAEVLVAPTMDLHAWGAVQHEQHARMMPFRAAETGRFLVRAASSGVSMVVAPDGAVRLQLGTVSAGILDARVPLRRDQTVYVRFGYLFPYGCQLAVILLGVTLFVRRFLRAPKSAR